MQACRKKISFWAAFLKEQIFFTAYAREQGNKTELVRFFSQAWNHKTLRMHANKRQTPYMWVLAPCSSYSLRLSFRHDDGRKAHADCIQRNLFPALFFSFLLPVYIVYYSNVKTRPMHTRPSLMPQAQSEAKVPKSYEYREKEREVK
jgi:hypothetical protein